MKKVMFLLLFGISLNSVWGYFLSPTNCLLDYGTKIVNSSLDFGKCFYHNLTFQGA